MKTIIVIIKIMNKYIIVSFIKGFLCFWIVLFFCRFWFDIVIYLFIYLYLFILYYILTLPFTIYWILYKCVRPRLIHKIF